MPQDISYLARREGLAVYRRHRVVCTRQLRNLSGALRNLCLTEVSRLTYSGATLFAGKRSEVLTKEEMFNHLTPLALGPDGVPICVTLAANAAGYYNKMLCGGGHSLLQTLPRPRYLLAQASSSKAETARQVDQVPDPDKADIFFCVGPTALGAASNFVRLSVTMHHTDP